MNGRVTCLQFTYCSRYLIFQFLQHQRFVHVKTKVKNRWEFHNYAEATCSKDLFNNVCENNDLASIQTVWSYNRAPTRVELYSSKVLIWRLLQYKKMTKRDNKSVTPFLNKWSLHWEFSANCSKKLSIKIVKNVRWLGFTI